ncbi:hypothetical protein LINPERHAP1_LOCUS11296, partial [Linum perenne]
YTRPRPTPAPPPEPWRDKAPDSDPEPNLGPRPALSQGPPLGPTLMATSPGGKEEHWESLGPFLEHRQWKRGKSPTGTHWSTKTGPGADRELGLVPKLGPMTSATSLRPPEADKDPLRASLKIWMKTKAEGLARINKGLALSQPRALHQALGTTEACFWPSQQLARAFWKILASLDSLKSQEHPPTNGAQFGGVLREIGLEQVLVMLGLSIKERSSDADPRKPMLRATIRPPPEPDPRKDALPFMIREMERRSQAHPNKES